MKKTEMKTQMKKTLKSEKVSSMLVLLSCLGCSSFKLNFISNRIPFKWLCNWLDNEAQEDQIESGLL